MLHTRTSPWKWASLAVTALSLAACAGGEPAQAPGVRLPSPGPDNVYTVEWPDPGRGAARYIRITIGADVLEKCEHLTPHFPLDSAKVIPQDRVALTWLANCLKTPPLDMYSLRLIGRADPRGDAEYNQDLGQRRAEAVRDILVSEGIAAARLTTSTRGETEAVGDQPEYSFGYDRRVDIVVVGETHAPGPVAGKGSPGTP